MIAFRSSLMFALLVLLSIVATSVQAHTDASGKGISFFSLEAKSLLPQPEKVSPLMRSILKVRGGEEGVDEDEEEDEYDDDEEEDDETALSTSSSPGLDYAAILEQVVDVTKTKVVPVVIEYSKKGASVAKKTSVMVYKALHRAIRAGLEGDDLEDESDDESDSDEEGDEPTVVDKLLTMSKKSLAVVRRMVKAALTVPEDEGVDEGEGEVDDDEAEVAESSVEEKEEPIEDETVTDSTAVEEDEKDFGSYLANAYEVEDLRNSGKTKGPIILGGSLQDALLAARQQARMLLVFIPSEKPKSEQGGLSFFGGKKSSAKAEENDRIAIESLVSKEVAKASNRKARKKQSEDFGSFAIWASKAGSSEAAAAIKRLKVKETSAKGEKRPILCVVYPASGGIGSDKISPKVLAQHHCNPPLKSESMASWMNALRKRHGKQYESMQTELKELQLYMERKEGYMGSVQSDNERKLKEAQEEAERKAREVKEAARQAEIDARRQELQQSLPEDIKSGSNVKKIALRFPDGRSGQRGFSSDEPLTVLFNWVDAMFEIERETVVLTTLNGKQTFSWEGDDKSTTLEEAGLKKMTAFRVSQAAEAE